MPAFAPHSLPLRPHVSTRCPDFDACWARVTVKSAEIARTGGPDRARAVIHLGRLTPADVRVELVPGEPSVADVAPPAPRRMFSSCAYGNGCFVFEAALTPADVAHVHDWMLHVHPRGAIERAVTHPIRPPA